MLRFIFKRVFHGILVVCGVVAAIFLLFNVLPGDPARGILGPRTDSAIVANVRSDLGLDKPLIVQFGMYVNDLSPISIHSDVDENAIFYLDTNKYKNYIKLYSWGGDVSAKPSTDRPPSNH